MIKNHETYYSAKCGCQHQAGNSVLAKRNLRPLRGAQALSAAGVTDSTVPNQETGPGSTPRAALHSVAQFGARDISVQPIPHGVAKEVSQQHHYLGSYPGGSMLNFGAFIGNSLLGVAVFGAGPTNIHRFFQGALPHQVLCLSRLWLDDRLGRNSESRFLGIILRHLRQAQSTIKAVVAYADPRAGHTGVVYQATGFLYLGQSVAMPLYRLPNGGVYHSRSLGHSFGTHSIEHFKRHGFQVELVPQASKHIYVSLIDVSWQDRLLRPALSCPKKEASDATG